MDYFRYIGKVISIIFTSSLSEVPEKLKLLTRKLVVHRRYPKGARVRYELYGVMYEGIVSGYTESWSMTIKPIPNSSDPCDLHDEEHWVSPLRADLVTIDPLEIV